MNIALWICQGVLVLAFVVSGTLKSTQSKPRMIATGQTGVQAYSLPFIRFIATCELFGVAGLILPTALGVLPVLTPVAAIGLAIIMIGAAHAHWVLREPRNVAVNAFLFTLCILVAWGRA
ncbi:MAG: DoxX family protein [Kofleriaceae bacterium]|nr:DoxX family protein [Kofleriaceae bacterium]